MGRAGIMGLRSVADWVMAGVADRRRVEKSFFVRCVEDVADENLLGTAGQIKQRN